MSLPATRCVDADPCWRGRLGTGRRNCSVTLPSVAAPSRRVAAAARPVSRVRRRQPRCVPLVRPVAGRAHRCDLIGPWPRRPVRCWPSSRACRCASSPSATRRRRCSIARARTRRFVRTRPLAVRSRPCRAPRRSRPSSRSASSAPTSSPMRRRAMRRVRQRRSRACARRCRTAPSSRCRAERVAAAGAEWLLGAYRGRVDAHRGARWCRAATRARTRGAARAPPRAGLGRQRHHHGFDRSDRTQRVARAGHRRAQARGLFEPDPTLDLDGSDAATKLRAVWGAVFGDSWRPVRSAAVARDDIRALDVEVEKARARAAAPPRDSSRAAIAPATCASATKKCRWVRCLRHRRTASSRLRIVRRAARAHRARGRSPGDRAALLADVKSALGAEVRS